MVSGAGALVALALFLAGCGASNDGDEPTEPPPPPNGAPVVDLTRLPLGDGRISTLPEIGAVLGCRQLDPPPVNNPPFWFSSFGTWDATVKPVIAGQVEWLESESRVVLSGDVRRIVSNFLPNHVTGEFPVATDDPAHQYEAVSYSIVAHAAQLELPRTPEVLVEPECVSSGVVGILLSGAPLYAPFDEDGRDAMAHYLFDMCEGTVNEAGIYHYHSVTTCLDDEWQGGHSRLAGYAADGFGIYGHYDVDGTVLTNDELDPCHGHTHEIEWDGETRVMYHYHATWEYPYTIGCFRGEPVDTGRIVPD